MSVADDDTYLIDVELLCVTCKQPIRARVNTPQWIRCEWMSPTGNCQSCHNKQKEQANADEREGRPKTTNQGTGI